MAKYMRRRKSYFEQIEGTPAPIVVRVNKRISFSEVDAMAIAWHGRYPQFFEMASEELARQIGLSYAEYYRLDLRAPIVKLHVDYFNPLMLDELITIEARMVWAEAARMNIEFTIFKENGTMAATGYTVQMFLDSKTNQPLLVTPEVLDEIRDKWIKGEFECLK